MPMAVEPWGKDASYLVERALEFGESTDGAFDIAIYPIMAEWGFTTGDFKFLLKRHWIVFWKKRNYRMSCLIKRQYRIF